MRSSSTALLQLAALAAITVPETCSPPHIRDEKLQPRRQSQSPEVRAWNDAVDLKKKNRKKKT